MKNHKSLEAIEVKNGWVITIKETLSVITEADVMTIIEKENLKYKPEFSKKKTIDNRIYASN